MFIKKCCELYKKFKFINFLHFKVMTEHIKISYTLSFALLLWSSLQNISLIFTSFFYANQTLGPLFLNFLEFLEIFQPLLILELLNIDSMITFFYTFLILLSFGLLVYFASMHIHLQEFKERRYFGFHFVFLDLVKLLTMIWIYIFVIPIFQIYYSAGFCLIKLYSNFNLENSGNIETPFLCSTKNNYLLVMTVVLALPSVYYGLLSSIFFCVEKFELDNPLANSASNLSFTYFFYKTYLVIINFQLSAINPLAVNAILLIFSAIMIKSVLTTHTLFDFRLEKVFFCSIMTEIYTIIYLSFLNIVGYSANQDPKQTQFVNFELFYFIMLPLFIKISMIFYEYYLQILLESEFSKKNSLYFFDKKVRVLYYFILCQEIHQEIVHYNFKDPLSYVVKGYFTNHSRKCVNPDCLCRAKAISVYDYKTKKDYIIDKENLSDNFHNIIFIKHFLRYQYRAFVRNFHGKNPSAAKLKMSYFLFTVVNNYHKSVVELIEIKELKHKNVLSMQEDFLLERLMLESDCVLLNLNRNYDKNPLLSNLNFEELIQYEKNYLALEKAIQEFSNNLLQYFSNINDERPNFETLSRNSERLSELKREINSLYVSNHNNPRTIAFYKEYLRCLLFNEDEEISLSKMLNLKNEKIQNYKRDGKLIYDVELMYNENSILIQISTTNANLGNIVKVNKGAAKYLGYSIEELESSNINIIMPKRIHENHDRYLKNYMESGRGTVLYVERRLFLRKKDGFLGFISLITKPMFEIKENIFKFIGYMQPLTDEYELIVTDETGLIDGMSKKLGFKLRIFPKDFEKEKIYIQNLCPSLAEYYFERADEQGPVYVYDFKSHPKSSKHHPILKFFRYSNQASSFKFQIDTVMRSLGDSIKKTETFASASSPTMSKKTTRTRGSFTKNLSKKWNTTRHQLEKEFDFFLMECKLNILIPSDNSIELIFFFVKEIDISEEENLNIPLASEHSEEPNPISRQNSMKNIKIERIPEEIVGSGVDKSFDLDSLELNDVPNLDEKLQDMVSLRSCIMPQLNEQRIKSDNTIKKVGFGEFIERNTPSLKRSGLSPKSNKRTNRSSISKHETYKSYLTKRLETQRSAKEKKDSEHIESKIKTNSEKIFQFLDLVRKNNDILVDHDMKSEQNSTTSSALALSKKFLKNTINIQYIPPCFTYLKYGLVMSILLIWVSQIINSAFVLKTYQKLRNNFSNGENYERLGPLLIRTLNTSYRLILLKAGVLNSDTTLVSELNALLYSDADKIMDCVELLSDQKTDFDAISSGIYSTPDIYILDSETQIILKMTDALVLYVSKVVGFANEGTYQLLSPDFYFMISNQERLLSVLQKFNAFDNSNTDEVSLLELECLCLVFIALFLVMVFMLYRIKYYRSCYIYMNKIFTMLAHISYEDLNVLKNYVGEAILFFRHDKQVKHLINNKMNGTLANINTVKENAKEKDAKKFQRKNKTCEFIALPLKTLVPFNFLLYLIILGGYVALLSFSNIFNKDLSNKVFLKTTITPTRYIEMGQALASMYDNIAANRLNFSFYQRGESYLLDYYQNMTSSQSITFLKNSISDSYFDEIFSLYQQEDFCAVLYDQQKIKYPNFFGPNYFALDSLNVNDCVFLMQKALTQGINGFRAKFFQNLRNIAQYAFNLSATSTYPSEIFQEIKENELGLEILNLRLQIFESDFVAFEISYFENLQSILIGVVSLEFIAFFISIFIYWKTIDFQLKKKLIDARVCFDHFPLAVIMKQTYIMKYLQETSSSLLK